MLEIKNLKAGYTTHTSILNDVSFTLSDGEVLAVVGQNGSGKSTLAKAIMNMLPYCEGAILYKGKHIEKIETKDNAGLGIAYMMQGGSVFPELTVKENLLFAAQNDNYLKEIVSETLKKHWNKQAGLLSGGERHQLALEMVLINKPKIVILDEPSAGLSPIATKELYSRLENAKQQHITMLLIEQNVNNAIQFADRVLLLQNGKIKLNQNCTDKKMVLDQIKNIYFK